MFSNPSMKGDLGAFGVGISSVIESNLPCKDCIILLLEFSAALFISIRLFWIVWRLDSDWFVFAIILSSANVST